MQNWINARDQLPEVDETVIVSVDFGYDTYGVIGATYLGNGKWEAECGMYYLSNKVIRYWRPYPEPPKEDKDEIS